MTDTERVLTEGKILALLEQLPDEVRIQFYSKNIESVPGTGRFCFTI